MHAAKKGHPEYAKIKKTKKTKKGGFCIFLQGVLNFCSKPQEQVSFCFTAGLKREEKNKTPFQSTLRTRMAGPP